VVLAVVDHTAGTLTYCSAGHPPAFLRQADTGRVIRLDDANGPVLGPIPDAAFQDGSIPVRSGDVLVLYTDGLVEGPDMPIPAGIARAERLISDWPASALMDCAALTDKMAPPPRYDDICVLVVRFD
jgi:serine phosphatase RsbU (regulator of sigma subunit)